MTKEKGLYYRSGSGRKDMNLEELYDRYGEKLYQYLVLKLCSSEDAEDVLQETFTYLLGKFPKFRLTASMTTFLYPAVKHISLALRRKSRPYVPADEALGEAAARPGEGSRDWRADLAAVLAGLADEQREVLLMRFVDGMRLEEIAVALDIPVSTAKSRLYRALEKLRCDSRVRDYFLE